MRLGDAVSEVKTQPAYSLGYRNGKEFLARPDFHVTLDDRGLLIDAKYKGRSDVVGLRVSASDVYEALAFLRAADANRMVLLYPRRPQPDEDIPRPGSISQFESIIVDDNEILAFEVESRGIGRRGGLTEFSQTLTSALATI